ncbi:MAG: O-antigen ligase family protein [Saprospiraceae bacterium]
MLDKLTLGRTFSFPPVLVGMVAVVLLSVFSAIASGYYWLVGIPFLLFGAWMAVVDIRLLYWLLIICIPFSTEVNLPGGFGTDLPTEPLMVGLMVLALILWLSRVKQMSFDFIRHPLTLLLLLHIGWLVATTITSALLLVSVKFLLAKIWYVVTFFFLTAYIIRTEADVDRFFRFFFWPFILMVGVIFTRHALDGFSFQGIHGIMHPFQRNHVNYAAQMALFFPWIWLYRSQRSDGSLNWYWIGVLLFLLVAIYFSFTRAAYVSLVIALGVYFVVRWKMMKVVLILAVVAAIAGVVYLINDDKYLDYAPNFERTVSHEAFDNLIEATYKMEDISTMERLYRWVAARHMAPVKPWMGWGPGNFVNFYESYTVTSFRTYVSHNPERSGIHNYFLMTLTDQGFPGLVIFIVLLIAIFVRGEKIYHALSRWPTRQRIALASLLSLSVIISFLLINDLIETTK